MSEFYADDTNDVGLLYDSGITPLDIYDLYAATSQEGQTYGQCVEIFRDRRGFYSGMRYEARDNQAIGHRLSNEPLNQREVADLARDATYVIPTAHCSGARELAEIAEQIGLNYPSPEMVDVLEDKRKFYEKLAAAGMLVPETRWCDTAEDAAKAVRAIGKMCIVKTAGGHSSLGLKTIDGSRQLSPDDLRVLDEHVALRDALRLQEGGSIVQERFGDAEWGFEAMFEVSRKGIEIFWHMSTRKIMQPPYGRMVAHIYDPEDEERIAITQDLLLPTVKESLAALLEGTRDRQAAKVGRVRAKR